MAHQKSGNGKSKKRIKRRSTQARMYPMRNKHHILPRSREGGNERENIVLLRIERHESWHLLFGDKTIEEVIGLLLRVHRIKGRCTNRLTGYCALEAMYGTEREASHQPASVLSPELWRVH